MKKFTETQKANHVRLGRAMKRYRESVPREDGSRGITQNELMIRLASPDFEHKWVPQQGIISRWERGKTPPTPNKLQDIGKVLNLTEAQVQDLIKLTPPVRERGAPGPHQL